MKKINKGFTLVELLVAIFVLTVGIAGVLAIFPIGTKIEKTNQMSAIATQLAQEKMEDIISASYNELNVATTLLRI